MSDEVWLEVEGYEGLYEVSSYGRVRSVERVETFISKRNCGDVLMTRKRKSSLLVPSTQDYETVRLYNHGTCYACLVHRLVAHAFIDNIDFTKDEVNHIDESKLNNMAYNLEWVTRSENAIHSVKSFRGSKAGMSKLNEVQVMQIKQLLADGVFNQTQIGDMFGVSNHTVSSIKRGQNWGWLTVSQKEVS